MRTARGISRAFGETDGAAGALSVSPGNAAPSAVFRRSALDQRLQRRADVTRRRRDAHAGRFEREDLVLRGALAAADDRAGVAHAFAGRRGRARDETGDRLLHVFADEFGAALLGVAADLTDHDHAFGV